MAAALIELRTFLRQVIGLGKDPEELEISHAGIDEGVDIINELAEVYDDGIKKLCSNVRKPVGSIPDPVWVAPDPNHNVYIAPNVAKPSKSISTTCEQRLMLVAYGVTVYTCISRSIATTNLCRSRLKELKQHAFLVENREVPDSLETISKTFTVMNF